MHLLEQFRPSRSVLGIPLRKGEDGEGVRPILVGEALIALPAVCLQHVVQSKATKLLAPTEFGIGVEAAPETMIALCKALAKLSPGDAFGAFDMENAFGEVSRAEIFEEVLESLPEIALFVLQLWGTDGTPIFCANGSCSWHVSKMVDGLFQGNNLSSLLFCFALKRGLRRFYNSCDESVVSSVHVEYIDDLVLQFQPHLAHLVVPVLKEALATVNLRLNNSKSKVLIPSTLEGEKHSSLEEDGLPQVFHSMELLGGAMEGEFSIGFRFTPFTSVPGASLKRLEAAEALADKLIRMIATPLSRASYRAIWTLVDKVLNKTLDYDARILHPELFSPLAVRLALCVRKILLKLVHVVDFDVQEEKCLRLAVNQGGCGITSAAACQYMPAVTKFLVDKGWQKESIERAVDMSGVHACLRLVLDKGVNIGSDGSVAFGVAPLHNLEIHHLLWGRSQKLYGKISLVLEENASDQLRVEYDGDSRQLARLNSCAGFGAGKWLQAFPSSWWPKFTDDVFVMAVRFRCGMRLSLQCYQCMHSSCKDNGEKLICGKDCDRFGDHPATCAIGGHFFSRHTALNHVLGQAGRGAGYQVLLEQVVPEFARWKKKKDGVVALEEARVDVELFGHPVAPARYLDGTIRHPASVSAVSKSAEEIGFAAAEGEKVKAKRYPPCNGKEVIACSMETWGCMGESLDALLRDLAVLATNRQRERGIYPTKWCAKWSLQISLNVALHVAKSLLESLPSAEKYQWATLPGGSAFHVLEGDGIQSFEEDPGIQSTGHGMIAPPGEARGAMDTENPYPGGGRLNTLTHD